MRPIEDLRKTVLDFVRESRESQSVFELCAELENLGMHGARIPAMKANKWKGVVDELITDRLMIETNGVVSVPVVEDKPKQMELF